MLLSLPAAAADPPVPVETTDTEPLLLRYRFAAGTEDSYRIDLEQHMSISGAAVGEPAETVLRMELDAVQAVSAVDDAGTAQIEERITGTSVNLTVNEQSIPAEDVAAMLNGLQISFSMTDRGVVTATQLEGAQDPQMAQLVSLVEDSIRHTTVEFPEGPVAVGETWSQQVPVTVEQPGMTLSTTVDATYTFLGLATVNETSCAVLQTDLAVSLSGVFDDVGIHTTAEGTGTGTGYQYFDYAAGKLVHGTMDLALDTQISAEGMEFAQAVAMSMSVSHL